MPSILSSQLEPPVWNSGSIVWLLRDHVWVLTQAEHNHNNIHSDHECCLLDSTTWTQGMKTTVCWSLVTYWCLCDHCGRNPNVQTSKWRLSLIVTLSSSDPEKDMHAFPVFYSSFFTPPSSTAIDWWLSSAKAAFKNFYLESPWNHIFFNTASKVKIFPSCTYP